jgi:hypothetical protein
VKLNVAALAALASAPPPPDAKAEGAVSTDTTVSWRSELRPAFRIYCRRTDAAQWMLCPGNPQPRGPIVGQEGLPTDFSSVLKGIRVDDWVFGVSSVGANGFESPVASAVPGGAFKPYVPPPAGQ